MTLMEYTITAISASFFVVRCGNLSQVVDLFNIMPDLSDWIKSKTQKLGPTCFLFMMPPQLQLRNRFSVLETEILEAVQQSPRFAEAKGMGIQYKCRKVRKKEINI
jgi:hypothetical protein